MGKRGPKKGTKYKPTLAKEAAREVARALITAQLEPLIAAQIANAQGIKYLVVRDKTSGKFLRVPKNAAEKLDPTEEIIEVWEKDPSVQAFTDLLNRALDKPKEQAQDVNVTGTLTLEQLVTASLPTHGQA